MKPPIGAFLTKQQERRGAASWPAGRLLIEG